jgi:hypothetical protein
MDLLEPEVAFNVSLVGTKNPGQYQVSILRPRIPLDITLLMVGLVLAALVLQQLSRFAAQLALRAVVIIPMAVMAVMAVVVLLPLLILLLLLCKKKKKTLVSRQ